MAVEYGCKDGAKSKTIKGCEGHGGAETIKTFAVGGGFTNRINNTATNQQGNAIAAVRNILEPNIIGNKKNASFAQAVGLSHVVTEEAQYTVVYGCKDGTTSKTAAGCSNHGGADWVKTS